ncbi:MAG: ATP-binding protein [Woeseiaceae bacterium]|nr:ATP-binding protein [Woeseiaceae bacterium]
MISVSVLLLFFFGATIVVLDTAFVSAGEQAREDILDGHLMQLLAAAEPNDEGKLSLPIDLFESRFNRIGSGLYAELRGENGELLWQSRSSLGLDLPFAAPRSLGQRVFAREALPDGTPLLTLAMSVQWEFPDETLRPYVFKVFESLDSFNAQIANFRRQLFGWFAAVALIMLLSISVLMRSLLGPLRQVETEIGEIEEGKRVSLSEDFPDELSGVARNMNLLIDSERARSERYRTTLDNLAHSLKTPLAAVRALLQESADGTAGDRINEQIDRMDEIVRYQLRKPASSAEKLVLTPVAIGDEIDRLVAGLRKVYRDKSPHIESHVTPGMTFRGDAGDFLELAGNLVDNACKWCRGKVRITIEPAGEVPGQTSGMILRVEDDGPGIPDDAAEALLQRGTRLDESTPGHGIGLAIVKDIARSYGGMLTVARSALGGAKLVVTIPPPRSASD